MSPILGIWASQNYPRVTTSFESIATETVGSGGAASVTFSSISSTYTHLQIRAIARSAAADVDDNLAIRFNSDSGSNYATHFIYGDGSAAYAAQATSETRARTLNVAAANATTSIFGAGVIDILDYKDTNKYKTVRTLAGNDRNGAGIVIFRSALWLSTSAISSITVLTLSGSNLAQYSHFALYGIRSA